MLRIAFQLNEDRNAQLLTFLIALGLIVFGVFICIGADPEHRPTPEPPPISFSGLLAAIGGITISARVAYLIGVAYH